MQKSDQPVTRTVSGDEIIEEYIVEDDDHEARGCSGCAWGLVAAAGCLMVPLVALVAGVIFSINIVTDIWDGITGVVEDVAGEVADFFRGEEPGATITTSETIVTRIQPLGLLVTTSVDMQKDDVRVGIASGFQNACYFAASHVMTATVEAGIDLSGFSEDSVRYDPETQITTVQLPAPQLTSCRINAIDQFDRRIPPPLVCGPDWDQARQIAQFVGLNEFRDDAVEDGILGLAEAEASGRVYDLLLPFTGPNLRIAFTEPDPNNPVVPESCAPAPPPNWFYDEVENRWMLR
jgi:hypothetical protein